MLLNLSRDFLGEKATIGNLFIDDKFECITLEDKVREIEGLPVDKWKIPHKTAIPRGKYRVLLTYSERFKRILPILVDVPGYTGVRIHSGNTDVDTDGCILTGREKINDDFISHSKETLEILISKIHDAISVRFEEVWIDII